MKFLVSIFAFLTCTFCQGATYYFSSSTGDDSRTVAQARNPATPWKTIAKFNSQFPGLQPGDSVLFHCGEEFPGAIIISASGTAVAPITIGTYGKGAMPVISGFTTLAAWKEISNGLYETIIPGSLASLNMVLFNGSFQPIGRWPKLSEANAGYLRFDANAGTDSLTASGPVQRFIGGELVDRSAHWILSRRYITAQEGKMVRFRSYTTPIGSTYQPKNGYGFFFQNHPAACTSPGDWCYDPVARKIKVFFGSAGPGAAVVRASAYDILITIAAKSYIRFSGISIQGANTDAFKISGSTGIQLLNCSISFSGQDAIWIDASPAFHMQDCTVSTTNNNAITANSNPGMIIRGNTITNTGMVAGMGVSGDGQYEAMSYIGAGSLVELNTIDGVGYIGIHFVGANTIIKKNFIKRFCTVKDDGAGIYSWGDGQSGSKVLNNIVLDGAGAPTGTTDTAGTAQGIYMDDNVTGVEIAYNTAGNNAYAGLLVHNANNLDIHDNIFYNNATVIYSGGQACYSNEAGTMKDITLTRNIFFSRKAFQDVTSVDPSGATNVPWFATANHNYYCHPLNESSCFFMNLSTGFLHTDLKGWQAHTGRERDSKITPVATLDVDKTRFEYNASDSPKTLQLDGNYIDVSGTRYEESITLAPYASVVLLFAPPWWRTWWAYSIYGLMFIVLVFTIYRFQKKRPKKKMVQSKGRKLIF